jgi:hypothetical protein
LTLISKGFIGGQLDAGFRLTALYADRHRGPRVAEFMPTYAATRL